MKPFRQLLALTLALSLSLSACGGTVSPAPTPEASTPAPTASLTPEPLQPPDPIYQQLQAMTREEKVGQLFIAGFEGLTAGEDARIAIQDIKAGGIIFYPRNIDTAQQLTDLSNRLKELNGEQTPLLFCTDQEGGLVSRVPSDLTRIPSAYSFGSISDPDKRSEACFLLGQTLAAQCAAFDIRMDFAPVMDIWSNPANKVIGTRAFGTDVTASEAANEAASGMMSGGVIPVAKHFPGHGDTTLDSHYDLPVVTKTLDELRELELVPFRRAIEETSIPSIMIAHILMTEIDPDRPSSLSPAVVTGLLREEMGFEGLICTDDLTMGAISDSYGVGEAAVMALEAGCDLLLVCHGSKPLREAYEGVLEAVDSGRIAPVRLDESVHRILTLKEGYGVTNHPIGLPDVAELNRQTAKLLEALSQ